ncbi:unnamed protein product [Callosobruchus maculatus]|uniref:Uncharacterized protein n=1 Tax=Callosobruchus maculatus TaxID=64391 RepID=A0A653D5X2_CALMS|nr:unnamed protein product [Callosobruchus maculatus]
MFIIDIQGFTNGCNFICKEIAIMNTVTGYWQHKLINWTVQNLHGLPWDLPSPSAEDFLYYEQITTFIKDFVQDAPIFVKGHQKKQWLERIITNHVTDLYDAGCPSLATLKKTFKYRHCFKHLYNNLTCALENVHLLYNWKLITNLDGCNE